jgi:hypothetical protein
LPDPALFAHDRGLQTGGDAKAMNATHVSRVCDLLVEGGVHEEQSFRAIQRGLYAWPSRVWEAVRVSFGGNPFSAERQFVSDFAQCSNPQMVEQALLNYENNPLEGAGLLQAVLGGVPTRARALRYFRQLTLGESR